MPSITGNRDQMEEAASDDAPNRVSITLASGADIDSIVLAYRDGGGELVKLAERTVPASAELAGELD